MLCFDTVLVSGRQVVIIMNPQPADISTCALVAGTQAETVTPLLNMTEADGALVAGAILLLWAVAWVFRSLIRTLTFEKESQNEL